MPAAPVVSSLVAKSVLLGLKEVAPTCTRVSHAGARHRRGFKVGATEHELHQWWGLGACQFDGTYGTTHKVARCVFPPWCLPPPVNLDFLAPVHTRDVRFPPQNRGNSVRGEMARKGGGYFEALCTPSPIQRNLYREQGERRGMDGKSQDRQGVRQSEVFRECLDHLCSRSDWNLHQVTESMLCILHSSVVSLSITCPPPYMHTGTLDWVCTRPMHRILKESRRRIRALRERQVECYVGSVCTFSAIPRSLSQKKRGGRLKREGKQRIIRGALARASHRALSRDQSF